MIVSADMEWNAQGEIDVLGLSWNQGKKSTSTGRTPQSMEQFLNFLKKADLVGMQNGIDADCRQLAKNGYDVEWLERKIYDIRLAFFACNGHLAGTGSFDLRSIVLLANGRQGERFPLDWKDYEGDLYKTCAFDAAAVDWVIPTLQRQVEQNKLEGIVQVLHRAAPIFARMSRQGVRLDVDVLEAIYRDRKERTENTVQKYKLWEDRGKKVIKRVPIWRSNKILDICEREFGFRPADRKRATWVKLKSDNHLTDDAREFIDAILDLGKGANDAHWLGKPTEEESEVEGEESEVSFGKVDENGFIFPRYDLCGSPDRATTASPSIQNWPRPKEDPRKYKLRSAVIPLRGDHTLLGVDFSSVETITNAIESNDWDRVNATLQGRITHQGTADLVNNAFGLELDRQAGKAINHGFDKGESPANLAKTLSKSDRPSKDMKAQCETIYRKMLDEYPKTAAFREQLWEQARANPLTVTNSFGRKLRCFSRSKYGDSGEWRAKHDAKKKYWCSCPECGPRRDRWKYAIAFLGRSAAFDALLQKMIMIWEGRLLDEYSLPYLEVHDELVYSVPQDMATHYMGVAKAAFESPVVELGGVCLPANAIVGKNWSEAH